MKLLCPRHGMAHRPESKLKPARPFDLEKFNPELIPI